MKCDVCGKTPATVHLTQVVENKSIRKVDLCEDCAKAHGVNDPTELALVGLLQKMGKELNLE